VPPQMADSGMPYMSFGTRPMFFDAPADSVPSSQFRATAFLTYSPDVLMTKVVAPICGFHWGFDRITGESRSLPIQPASRMRRLGPNGAAAPVDVSRLGVPAGNRRRHLAPPAATGADTSARRPQALRLTNVPPRPDRPRLPRRPASNARGAWHSRQADVLHQQSARVAAARLTCPRGSRGSSGQAAARRPTMKAGAEAS
jgi:hypothetical protein